ncbi:uncharacterized protein [Rhodnius prolixus]|uniref:uncharacterized protein n=1 Tax=Rhodnius prolixus TaxID=13249 RepID=UPI003D188D01
MAQSAVVNSEVCGGGAGDPITLILSKLDNITSELATIKTELNSFKMDMNNSLQQVNKDILITKKEVVENRKQTKILNQQMSYAKQQIVEFSQVPYQNFIRIDNIPFKEKENLIDLLKTISNAINVELNENSIDFVYRQRSKRVIDCPSIIVKFVMNSVKTNFLIHSKQSKSKLRAQLFEPNSSELIYVNEYLSSLKYNVLKKAKFYKKEGHLHSVWTRNGKIYVRLLENSSPQVISTQEDLITYIGLEQQETLVGMFSDDEGETDGQGTDSSSVKVGKSCVNKKRKLKRAGLGNMKSFLIRKSSQESAK